MTLALEKFQSYLLYHTISYSYHIKQHIHSSILTPHLESDTERGDPVQLRTPTSFHHHPTILYYKNKAEQSKEHSRAQHSREHNP